MSNVGRKGFILAQAKVVCLSRVLSGEYRPLFTAVGRTAGEFVATGDAVSGLSQGDDAVIYCASRSDGGFQILHAFNFGHESSIPLRASSKVSRARRGKYALFHTHIYA